MADFDITHAFVSTKNESSDDTIASKNEWNAPHVVDNDINGQYLVVSATYAPTNLGFVDQAKAYNTTYTVPGSTALPLTVANTVVTKTSVCIVVVVLTVTGLTLANGTAITLTIGTVSGGDVQIFTDPGTANTTKTYTSIIGTLPSVMAPGSVTWRVTISGTANVIAGSLKLSVLTIGITP